MSPAGTVLSTKYRFPENVLVASMSSLSGSELAGAARWNAAAVAPVKVSPMKDTALSRRSMDVRFYGIQSTSRIEVRIHKLQAVWRKRGSESENSQRNAVAVERHVLIEVVVPVSSLFDTGLPIVVGDEIQDLMIEHVILPREDPVHGIVVGDIAGIKSPDPSWHTSGQMNPLAVTLPWTPTATLFSAMFDDVGDPLGSPVPM